MFDKRMHIPRVAALCAVALAVSSVVFASTIEVPSPSSDPAARYSVARDTQTFGSVFVGHYGETLALPIGWTAEARMRGPMEIVYLRKPDYGEPSSWPAEVREDATGTRVVFRAPAIPLDPTLYKPENFTPLHLMQLLVIPKDAPGGYRSLRGLRRAKEKELSASGLEYTAQGSAWFGDLRDSFSVTVLSPYRLHQIYTQSDRNIFILSSGLYPGKPYPVSELDTVALSLANHLSRYRRAVRDQNLFFDARYALIPLGAVLIFVGLLALVPRRGRWTSRLTPWSRATLLFSAVWPLYGLPLIYIAFRFGYERWLNSGSILLMSTLLMPWVFYNLSRRTGGLNPGRVLLWTTVLGVCVGSLGYGWASLIYEGFEPVSAGSEFWMVGSLHGLFAAVYGILFAIVHRVAEKQP